MTRYEAEVDPEVCIGAQMCVGIAPETFVYDDEAGKSRAVGPPSDDEGVLDAAEVCPVGAITVRDADLGERLFP